MSDSTQNFSYTANGVDFELDENGKWQKVEPSEQVKVARAYVSAFITTGESSVFIRGYIQELDEHHFKIMPTKDFHSEAFGLTFDRRNITHLSIYPAKE